MSRNMSQKRGCKYPETPGDEDQREGWLRDLCVGDGVVVANRGGWGAVEILSVTRITPTGHIIVGSLEFNANGNRTGSRGDRFPGSLERLTPKMRDGAERKVLIVKLYARLAPSTLQEIPTDALRQAVELLTPKEKAGG